ncbi:P-loop containing nucleoside triphosphate hydrolase protein [Dipodascopsis tothii]|uniref:P-loop containing nucleoside triphosphate hydrolase protein n=1 Tax=Dipodascopsis tothii TaxID=44089 RepID=UPI0034CDF173
MLTFKLSVAQAARSARAATGGSVAAGVLALQRPAAAVGLRFFSDEQSDRPRRSNDGQRRDDWGQRRDGGQRRDNGGQRRDNGGQRRDNGGQRRENSRSKFFDRARSGRNTRDDPRSSLTSNRDVDLTVEEAEEGAAPVAFEDVPDVVLHKFIKAAIKSGFGYEHMSEVQSMVMKRAEKTVAEAAAAEKFYPGTQLVDPSLGNLVVKARTGTGKTFGFLLPALNRALFYRENDLAIRTTVIVAPSRELAAQIYSELQKLLQYVRRPYRKPIQSHIVYGGTSVRNDVMRLREGTADFIIGTPGRLLQHLDRSSPVDEAFAATDTLVFDEADNLLEVGFRDQIVELKRSIERLREAANADIKPLDLMLFSATFESVQPLVRDMVPKGVPTVFINTVPGEEAPTHEKVPQHVVQVDTVADQVYATYSLLRQKHEAGEPLKAIVFAATNNQAVYLGRLLYDLFKATDLRVWKTCSKYTQSQRTRTAREFREATRGVLVSSDVSARGMDFPNVTDVIQVGAASTKQQYVHRVGRTARGSNMSGNGYVVLLRDENYFQRELQRDGIKLDDVHRFTAEPDLIEAVDNAVVPSLEAYRVLLQECNSSVLAFYASRFRQMRTDLQDFSQYHMASTARLVSAERAPLNERTAQSLRIPREARGVYELLPEPSRDHPAFRNESMASAERSRSRGNSRGSRGDSAGPRGDSAGHKRLPDRWAGRSDRSARKDRGRAFRARTESF